MNPERNIWEIRLMNFWRNPKGILARVLKGITREMCKRIHGKILECIPEEIPVRIPGGIPEFLFQESLKEFLEESPKERELLEELP